MAEKSPIQPRFLSREQAAAYVGVCPSVFDGEVRKGLWPPAQRRGERLGRLTWDVKLLDLYADQYSGLGSASVTSPTARPVVIDEEAIALERSTYVAVPNRPQNRRPKAA
jgi:hypothetical protein